MDAKTLAADIRKNIRAATRDENDPLHGLTISVRLGARSSTSSAIQIGVARDFDTFRQDADQPDAWGNTTEWTREALAISRRLHELAAPALTWADGRHSFCFIDLGGCSAPRNFWILDDIEAAEEAEDARLEELNRAELEQMAIDEAADDAVQAEDEITDPELCPGCLEVMGACDCEGYDHSRAKEDARNAAAGIDPTTPTAPTCPNGHGPMRGSADITTGGENLGTWHTCTDGCQASYIAPSQALLRTLADRAVVVGHQPTAPTHEYGIRRGPLAAVR